MIHLSGARDERLVADNYQRENIPAYVAAFHHQMEEVYSAADFAIARSGAASLAELAAFSLPAILIPFPYAADDHQTRNAEIFVAAEAAIVLKESELSGDLLARKIRELIERSDQARSACRKILRARAEERGRRWWSKRWKNIRQPNHDAALLNLDLQKILTSERHRDPS